MQLMIPLKQLYEINEISSGISIYIYIYI